MKNIFNHSKNQTIFFFLLYFVLMGSLIFAAVSNPIENSDEKTPTLNPELSLSFKEEMAIHKEKVKQKEIENAGKWQPSKQFVMIAMISASILDIIIVLLWARHENIKREKAEGIQSKRITDSKWFWNLVALGIVQPKNNRIVINWRNLFLNIVLLYFIKKLLIDKYWNEETSSNIRTLIS
ncbi:hypothetical protein SM124_18550 [Bacillus sp. 31A1R]|uniref:Uncharacterized protein n=1 Tax=Robertmurraya mangrovi TaxID=3098077 RepID=A0ABU5J2Z4_9BACI|nr:hypothetical protein [Bacillus sp. 31A1R]MDZ5473722.1 hypothetical protein [Bacillus sp. 31A1R]